MDSEASEKTTSAQESSKSSKEVEIPAKEKQEIVIVIVIKDGKKQLMTECLESLKKECGQHPVERCASLEDAFDYINQLDAGTTVILIVAGRSHESLKNDLQHVDSLPRAVRNCFIYSSENENTEKPATTLTHYIFGRRQLLSAIRDVLDAINAAPVHGHSDQYTSVTVHESTFNELFTAMKSIRFKYLGFTIQISQMEAVLSPSIFQFKAFAEVSAMLNILPHLKQPVHGECELLLDENTGKLMLKIKKLIIELPKLLGFGGGFTDVGSYIPPIHLKGFINFAHPLDLPDMCETRQLLIIPRNQKFIVEEKRATFSVQIGYAEAPPIEKK